MPIFSGGPLDGMMQYRPGAGDPTPDEIAGMMGGGDQGGPAPMGDPAAAAGGPPDDLSPGARFDRIHSDVRALLTGDDGEFSEQDKLIVSKVETLLSGFKAGREKESDQAMQGKLSPGLMKRSYSGGGAGY